MQRERDILRTLLRMATERRGADIWRLLFSEEKERERKKGRKKGRKKKREREREREKEREREREGERKRERERERETIVLLSMIPSPF